jgi:hypothetical protein
MHAGATDNYNQTSIPQALSYRPLVPFFPDLSHSSSITIADYGCALGANSIAPVRELLRTLPDGAAATLVLNDVASNDWNSVSRVVRERWDEVADGRLNICVLMSPRSFYHQVLPPASVDVGVSWTAMQYLSQVPILPAAATSKLDSAQLAALRAERTAAQGHDDLVRLLELRGVETRSGGWFIASLVATKSTSTEAYSTSPVFYALQKGLAKMVDAGRMTTEQVLAFEVPMSQRTESDVYAALDEVKGSWKLEAMFREEVLHPAWLKIRSIPAGEATERDREEYAEAVVAWGLGVLSWQVVRALRVGSGEVDGGSEMRMTELEKEILRGLRREMKSVLCKECSEWPSGIEYLYVKLRRL